MQSPSLASATGQRPAVALLSYPALRFLNSQLIAPGIDHRGHSAAPARSSSSPISLRSAPQTAYGSINGLLGRWCSLVTNDAWRTPPYLAQRTPRMRAAAKRRSQAELGCGLGPRREVYGALAGRLAAERRDSKTGNATILLNLAYTRPNVFI